MYGGGADSTGDGVNQYACSFLIEQTCLPIGEVSGEKINGKGGALFCGPIFWDRPEEIAMGDGLFGEGCPLRVTHHSASGGTIAGQFVAGEFASRGEGRLRSSGVSAMRGHQIGEVQASRFDFY